MKKTTGLFIAFLFMILTSGAQSTEKKTFEQPDYSIVYFKDWALDTSKSFGTELFLFSALDGSDDKFRDNISLVIQNLAGMNIDLDKYVSISEQQVSSLMTDGVLESSERLKCEKFEFQKIQFTMRQGVYDLRLVQYYIVWKEKAYVLTYTAEKNTFEKYINQVLETMNSLTLKQ